MRTVDLDAWEAFPKAIADIRAEFKTEVSFRGQADSEWQLATTLERTSGEEYSVVQYVQRVNSVVNEIESLTGKRWGLSPFPEICKEIGEKQNSLRPHLPYYEYLVYLRHHGFPSPLLDWSQSPYVAAYFSLEQSCNAERCCVIAFIERPERGKMLYEGAPTINSWGPYITTDSRHFSQKASYTTATVWNKEKNTHYFCPHDSIGSANDQQDVLVKITIPRADRIAAMKQLDDDYNINHYTLFHTEDSLVRSLGLKAMELKQSDA